MSGDRFLPANANTSGESEQCSSFPRSIRRPGDWALWVTLAPANPGGIGRGRSACGRRCERGIVAMSCWFLRLAPIFWMLASSAQAEAPPRLKKEAARLIDARSRSEEHTSELQSLMRSSYAVLCLKKKQATK